MKIINCACVLTLCLANSCRPQSATADRENPIVLVNTGSFNKRDMAKEIEIISRFSAKVIAVDIALPEYAGGQEDDDLMAVIEDARNVVLPSLLHDSGKDYYGNDIMTVVSASELPIVPIYIRKGFVSAEKEEMDTPRIPRRVMLWVKDYTGQTYYHFSVVTAMAYDSLKAIKYVQSHPQSVDVKFSEKDYQFKVFSGFDVRNGKVTKADVDGKIVVIGFLGPGDTDKFISPLNRNNGKADMYGMEYLARIIAQVLSVKE